MGGGERKIVPNFLLVYAYQKVNWSKLESEPVFKNRFLADIFILKSPSLLEEQLLIQDSVPTSVHTFTVPYICKSNWGHCEGGARTISKG